MQRNPWKTVSKKILYRNQFGYILREDSVFTPAGKKGKYMVLEGRGYVIIVPTTKANKILLVNQWRYPIDENSLELPAGTINKNELPENTAKRELLEETGGVSNNWTLLGEHWIGNGIMKIKGYVYLAKNIKVAKRQKDKIGEVSFVKRYKIEDILKKINQGKIKDARTQLGILLFYHKLSDLA